MVCSILRFIRGWPTFILLITAYFSAFAENLSEHLYLDTLLKDSLRCRSDVQAQEEVIEQRRQKELIIMSGLLPQINVDGTIQKSQDDTYAEQLLKANFSQTLFDPSGAVLEREVARLDTNIAQLQKTNIQDQIRLDLTRDFFYYRNRLYEESFQNSLEQSSLIEYKNALLKKAQGLYSYQQMQQAEAQFQNAKSKVFSLGNDRKIGKQHLVTSSEDPLDRTLIIPNTALIIETLWKEIEHHNPETLIKQALKYRTEFNILDAQIEQAEIKTDIARYFYLPSIEFNATTYKYHFNRDTLTEDYNIFYPWNLGLTMSWNFDSFGSLHSVRAARAERIEKVLTKKRTEFTVKDEVITSFLGLQNSAEALRSGLTRLDQARADFLKQKKSYEIGLISEVVFKQAQTTWEQAQTELENAVTTTVNKHEELMFNAGYPPGPSELQNLPVPPAPEFNTSEITLATEPGKTI